MKQLFQIQVTRADNGFQALAQSDVQGVKRRKMIATTEADIIAIVKDFADHMFDQAPKKEEEPKQ